MAAGVSDATGIGAGAAELPPRPAESRILLHRFALTPEPELDLTVGLPDASCFRTCVVAVASAGLLAEAAVLLYVGASWLAFGLTADPFGALCGMSCSVFPLAIAGAAVLRGGGHFRRTHLRAVRGEIAITPEWAGLPFPFLNRGGRIALLKEGVHLDVGYRDPLTGHRRLKIVSLTEGAEVSLGLLTDADHRWLREALMSVGAAVGEALAGPVTARCSPPPPAPGPGRSGGGSR